MPYQTVTLTSASTNTSAPVALNRIGGKPTSVSVIATSQSSGAFTIQFTLDDLQQVSSGSVAWQGASSGIGQTFPSTANTGTIFVASNAYPDGVFYTFLGPIAGLRLFSSATNNVNNGPITMGVVQGE
jgi:hypothetical protein